MLNPRVTYQVSLVAHPRLAPAKHELLIAAVALEAVERCRPAAAFAAHAGIFQHFGIFDLAVEVAFVQLFAQNLLVDMLQLQDREDLR